MKSQPVPEDSQDWQNTIKQKLNKMLSCRWQIASCGSLR